ncbi:MAG: YbaB/EbfC family nucleoid-associated protein [Eubacteriales bacterium]|nr:YbaB/EbfC family nucleoid-associated protein [Eubacteriales bacterium]
MMKQQAQMQQKLMKMQQEMAKAQEDVENALFSASVGGGAVQATVSGKKQLVTLAIQPEAVDPEDVEMLQDLVISAVNEALRQADEAMNNSMSSLTGGLNIPGLF